LLDKINKSITEETTYKNKNSLSFIFSVFKKILPMPLNVWLIYVQTFMVFPGVAFKNESIFGLDNSWT